MLIFPTLSALAVNFIFGHMFKSGLAANLTAQCPPTVTSLELTPYRLPYTGLHLLDEKLCGLVAFFHAAMTPGPFPFLAYFMGTGAPLIAIPAVESFRKGRHFSIGYPLVVGFFCQVATVGVTMPVFWLLFIVSGAAKLNRRSGNEQTLVTHAHAEAIIFGVCVGSIIPTACMFLLNDPLVTAIWQAFPVWVSIAQFGHHLFRPASRYPESGYKTVRALFVGLFIVSSSTHLASIWPKIGDLVALQFLFLPSIPVLNPATTTVELKVLDFLKWDAVFGFASSILATFWFARNAKQFTALLAWHVVAVPVFGPGAAIAGVAIWRESLLNG